MKSLSPIERADPQLAAKIIAAACPSLRDRRLIFRQLLNSIAVAERIHHNVWSLTLFKNGFRLNVGGVETLTVRSFLIPSPLVSAPKNPWHLSIRILLHGDAEKALKNSDRSQEGVARLHASAYKSVPRPQFVYLGGGDIDSAAEAWSDADYQLTRDAFVTLASQHAAYIEHAARKADGTPRKAGYHATHSAGLYQYAKALMQESNVLDSPTENLPDATGKHFVAYHSAETMGEAFDPTSKVFFLSRKRHLLPKALNQTVWVIEGVSAKNNTIYSLHGAFVAQHIEPDNKDPSTHVISGTWLHQISPPKQLNELKWFPALRQRQSNFSLGFNRINDAHVVQSLLALCTGLDDLALFNAGFLPSAEEGSVRQVTHLRRERDPAIIEAKKESVMRSSGRLVCEACGFDFQASYGSLGVGFCEVHHRSPLSSTAETVTTHLEDLAVLCANCHRMIHRTNPMWSVSQLKDYICCLQSLRLSSTKNEK